MLPKVTLLSGEGTNFLFRFGSKLFDFIGGGEERVPVAVALALEGQKMPGGKPLFQIEDMPEIVTHCAERAVPVTQGIESGPKQLQF